MSHTPQKNSAVKVLALTKNRIKRIAQRLGFHFVAFITGVIISEVAINAPLTILNAFPDQAPQDFGASIGAMAYFGMLLLFPFQSNRAASSVGILSTAASLLTGYGVLGPVFGGLTTFIISTVTHRKANIGSVLALFFIGSGMLANPMALTSAPLWYYLVLGGSIISGIVYYRAITQLIDRMLRKLSLLPASPPVQQARVETPPPSVVSPPPSPAPELFDAQSYLITLQEIRQLKKSLPANFVPLIDTIILKTQAILHCMINDERDVARGTQFLNRYLPMLHTSLERFVHLSMHVSSSSEFAQVQEKTLLAFTDMSNVFSDMHQRLLDNDLNDLVVDLQVLDKLVRSEGYMIPRE